MKRTTIIYANRNRTLERIKASLDSLKGQNSADFEVVFVDYGSELKLVSQLQDLLDSYAFVQFYSLDVSQLLWNKSKALNFGIKKATSPYIFIADVDLIFHPEVTSHFEKLANPAIFFLFELGYLNKEESRKINLKYNFDELQSIRTGNVNGMLLSSKRALLEVNGLDEFFHFYGAEDEDLFARLENAGYQRELVEEKYFFHNWHRSFSGSEDKLLTGNPRVKNIMRINQQHFFRNRERGITKPFRQKAMGEIIDKEESRELQKPSRKIKINNILAQVEHFLREELPSYEKEVIEAVFVEDPYYHSLKHKTKKILNKQSQPYCSMKEVNDMLLKEILYNYRDANYSLKISEDLKTIKFAIKL